MLRKDKGIVLFLVLSTIFVVTILVSIVLNIVSSQSRLTLHQVSRIQAYYAAQAGMNYALEKLRVGTDVYWQDPASAPGRFYIRNLCSGCTGPGDINEGALPSSIQAVTIAVAYRGVTARIGGIPVLGCNPCTPPANINTCICTTATYTYTP